MATDRRVYAVMAGQVRNPNYQAMSLRTLEKAKAEGLIDDYVVSTWIGEIDQYSGLRDLYNSISGVLVETTEARGAHELDLVSYNKTTYNRCGWFFSPLVFNACRELPEDCMVSYSRLDVAFTTCDDYIQHLKDLRELDFDHNDPDCPLRTRIWVGGIHHWVPFWPQDRYFYGHRQDFENTFHISTIHDNVAHGHGCFPEIRYFSHVWLARNPLIRDLLRLDWFRMIQYSPGTMQEVWQELHKHYAFSVMMAEYYEVLRKYFYVFVKSPLNMNYYNSLDPVPPNGFLPGNVPPDWTILDPSETNRTEFQEALQIVRATPAMELHRSQRYRDSFAELEEGVRSVGLAILPMIRVKRGSGTIGQDGNAPSIVKVELPIAQGSQIRIHSFGPRQVSVQSAFDLDVIISVEDGFRIPAQTKDGNAFLTYYWRLKGENAVFGWEHARLPLRHDVVGVMVDRLSLWSPCNPGTYEIIADIVFEGVCWARAGIPFEILVG